MGAWIRDRDMYMAQKICEYMEEYDYHLKYPKTYTFILWVLTPRSYGGHYGLRNWIKYVFRK